jgi:hypothetical protein
MHAWETMGTYLEDYGNDKGMASEVEEIIIIIIICLFVCLGDGGM